MFVSVLAAPKADATAATTIATAAAATGRESLLRASTGWWAGFWPESFVTLPTTRLEGFYYTQASVQRLCLSLRFHGAEWVLSSSAWAVSLTSCSLSGIAKMYRFVSSDRVGLHGLMVPKPPLPLPRHRPATALQCPFTAVSLPFTVLFTAFQCLFTHFAALLLSFH